MINLEKGNSGPLVEMLQLALKRAGKDVEINGNYDEKLVNIVKEFQHQRTDKHKCKQCYNCEYQNLKFEFAS